MLSWGLGDGGRVFVSRRRGRACSRGAGGGASGCLLPVAPDLAGCPCGWINCVWPLLLSDPVPAGGEEVWAPPVFPLTFHCPHLDKALLVPGFYRVVTSVLLLWPSTHQQSALCCSCPSLCLLSLPMCRQEACLQATASPAPNPVRCHLLLWLLLRRRHPEASPRRPQTR